MPPELTKEQQDYKFALQGPMYQEYPLPPPNDAIFFLDMVDNIFIKKSNFKEL